MNRRSVWQFLKDIFTQWIEEEPFLLASSLSYYTLVSLTPLLAIAIAVAGLVFGREAAQNEIVQTIGGMIGPESAQAIQGMIENAAIETCSSSPVSIGQTSGVGPSYVTAFSTLHPKTKCFLHLEPQFWPLCR